MAAVAPVLRTGRSSFTGVVDVEKYGALKIRVSHSVYGAVHLRVEEPESSPVLAAE